MRESIEDENNVLKFVMISNKISSPFELDERNVSVDSIRRAIKPSISAIFLTNSKDVEILNMSYMSFSFRRFFLGGLCLEKPVVEFFLDVAA